MKPYTTTVTIDRPLDQVLALYDSIDHLKGWQPTLQSVRPIEGEPGAVGSQVELTYQMGKGEMQMIETVVHNDLPERQVLQFETKGVTNITTSRFEPIGDQQTRWEMTSEFRFRGLVWKIMSRLMKSAFPKQTLTAMTAFKEYAESDPSLSGADGPEEADAAEKSAPV